VRVPVGGEKGVQGNETGDSGAWCFFEAGAAARAVGVRYGRVPIGDKGAAPGRQRPSRGGCKRAVWQLARPAPSRGSEATDAWAPTTVAGFKSTKLVKMDQTNLNSKFKLILTLIDAGRTFPGSKSLK
jgi:hypothetical protein